MSYVLNYDFGDEEHDCEYDYEIDRQDMVNAVAEIVEPYSNNVDKKIAEYTQKRIAQFISDNDLEDEVFEQYEYELEEYFEDEARYSYKDSKEYDKDTMGYYGISQKDFI